METDPGALQIVAGIVFLVIFGGIGTFLALLFACLVVSVFGPRIR